MLLMVIHALRIDKYVVVVKVVMFDDFFYQKGFK